MLVRRIAYGDALDFGIGKDVVDRRRLTAELFCPRAVQLASSGSQTFFTWQPGRALSLIGSHSPRRGRAICRALQNTSSYCSLLT